MPKRNFVFLNNVYYHIYNKGFNWKTLFLTESDFEKFYDKMLSLQEEYKEKYQIEIKARCLMPNHFHILIIQKKDEENLITKFMQRLQNSYGKYYSIKYWTKWQVFDTRFKAKAIDDEEYLWAVVNYIQRNSEHHFWIPYKQRHRRSDIPIQEGYFKFLENLEWYKLE